MLQRRSEPIRAILTQSISRKNQARLAPALDSASEQLAQDLSGPDKARDLSIRIIRAQLEFKERFGRFGRREFMASIMPAAIGFYCREPEIFSSAMSALFEHGEDVSARRIGAFFRGAIFHMNDVGYRMDILADSLKDLQEALWERPSKEVLKETRAIFSSSGRKRDAKPVKIVLPESVKEALQETLPERVQESGIAELGCFTPETQGVLSGRIDPSTLTPFAYTSMMREIKETFATSDLFGAAHSKMLVEAGPDEAARFKEEYEGFRSIFGQCKSQLAKDPGRDFLAIKLENMEASLNRMMHDYIFSLSIAYSRIHRESVFRCIGGQKAYCANLLEAQKTHDVRKLLSMDFGPDFGFLSRGRTTISKGDDQALFSFRSIFLNEAAVISVEGNRASIRLQRDGRLLGLMSDFTPSHTMVHSAFLIRGEDMSGAFRTRTCENGIVLCDPDYGDDFEAVATIPEKLPAGRDALIFVDGEIVSIECGGRTIQTSLQAFRSGLKVVDRGEGLSNDDYIEIIMKPYSNIAVQSKGSVCKGVRLDDQKELLGKAVHIIRKTYGVDNASKVLSHTAEIFISNNPRAKGRATCHGAVVLSFNHKGANPEDVAFTLVHEDGHNYAEAILSGSFDDYLQPGTNRMIGYTSVSDMLKSTVHEIFANMALLRFGIQAVHAGTIGPESALSRTAENVERIDGDLAGLSRIQNLSEKGNGLVDILQGEFERLKSEYNQLPPGVAARQDLFEDFKLPTHLVWKHGSGAGVQLFFEEMLTFSIEPSLREFDKAFPEKKMLPPSKMPLLPSPQNEPLAEVLIGKDLVEKEVRMRMLLDRFDENEISNMAESLGRGEDVEPGLQEAMMLLIERDPALKETYEGAKREHERFRRFVSGASVSGEDGGIEDEEDVDDESDLSYDGAEYSMDDDHGDEYVVGINEPEEESDEERPMRSRRRAELEDSYDDLHPDRDD